ncbi:MAG: hypothetical protein GYA66_08590, partial [Phyllobacteriaceae bacterium]|nr:hypothetical protein [Phyllobacteriaceae bacterium]
AELQRAAHRFHEAVAQTLGRKLAESENANFAEVLMTGKVGARLERLAAVLEDALSGGIRLQTGALSESRYENLGARA